LQQAVSDRIQLERCLQNALLALDQLVGPLIGTPRTPSRITWSQPEEPVMLTSAKENSGELRRLRYQIEISQAQIKLAQSGLWPGLSLMHRRSLGGPGFVNQSARNQTFLSLDMSPGAGLSAAAQADAARARMDAASQSVDAYNRQLEQQVRNSVAEFRALQQQQPFSRVLVQATEDVVASYLRQYQIGRKNWLDVLNALRESVQAAYTAVDIDLGMQTAQVRLMLLSGMLRLDNLDLIHD
jgi:adhesin transport system outer membrane protein